GALHVITRTPRPFRIKTPFINANVEGTEFFVGVDDAGARLTVYEGRLSASNEQGAITLVGGEQAVIARNQAPRKELIARSRDAVQWALYYPAIVDYRPGAGIAGTPGEAALRESIELLAVGRL